MSTPTLTRGTSTTRSGSRAGAITVAAAPFLLLGSFLWHPQLLGRLPDNDAVAEAAAADITRWGLSHLAAAVASAAVAVAFLVVRGYLRQRGDDRPSALGVGLVVVGSTFYAVLPGMEFSILAAHESGADLAAAQNALQPWFITVLAGGSLVFAAGTCLFAVAVARVGAFDRVGTLLVVAALVVFGLSRLVPVGVVQFYVQSAAALVALLPLAAVIGSGRPAARTDR